MAKEANDDARGAAVDLIGEGLRAKERKTFIHVNNRMEGNALETIAAVLERLGASASDRS